MKDEILEENLRRLLTLAPERARLRPMVRERIKRHLREAEGLGVHSQPSTAAPQRSVRPDARPRRRWVPALAAAAALALLFFGTWRLFGIGAGSSPGSASGPTTPDAPTSGTVADSGRSPSPGSDSVHATGPIHVGPDLDPGSTAATQGGREPLVTNSPPDDLASGSSAGEDPGPSEPGALTGEAPELVAAVTLPSIDPSESARAGTTSTLSLWVKPVVQLPRVADPTAFEVPIEFSASLDGASLSASITVPDAMARTRAMGADEAILQVEYDGFAPSRVRVSVSEAAAGTVLFELQRGVSISGQVVDAETGAAIPGAVVVALDQLPLDALDVAVDPRDERLPLPFTVTGALGRFTLEHVAPTPRLRLRTSHRGLAPTTTVLNAQALDRTQPLTIELRPGSTVSGLVERADGTPWAGAFLVVSRQEVDPAMTDRPVMTFGSAICDAAGEFRIQGMPGGEYVALLFDPANPQNPLEFRQVRLDGSSEVRVDFRTGVTTVGLDLAGKLIDSEGIAVTGASLTLANRDGPIDLSSDWRVTDTDELGRFRFAGIQPSNYSIHLASDGFGRMALIWEGGIESSQDLEVTLPATSWTLKGVGAKGEGQSWAIIEHWRDGDSTWDFAGRAAARQIGDARLAAVDHLLPGRYRAVCIGPGHGATWTDPFDLESGRPQASELELLPGGPLTVQALDAATGDPIGGLVLEVRDLEGRMVPQQDVVRTDPQGQAVILGAPHGPLTIQLSGPSEPALGPPIEFTRAVEFDAASGVVPCAVQIP